MRRDERPTFATGLVATATCLLAWVIAGCSAKHYATPGVGTEHVEAPDDDERGSADERPGEVQPLRGMARLPVPEHTDAIVVVPGGSGRKPVLVATHGAGDRAEWHCEIWGAIVRGRGFVLCPQGRRIDNRIPPADSIYYYPDHKVLDREVVAALAALKARFPDRADTMGGVYTGFSQGAIFGALIIAGRPDVFPRAILVEGGHGHYGEWNRAQARKYRRGGGKRVFFACGGRWCNQNAKGIIKMLQKEGIEGRLGYAEGAGHTMSGPMEPHLVDAFEWAISDDPRWR